MRRYILFPLNVLLVLLLAGYAFPSSQKGQPPPDGKAVIDYITNIDDYRQWEHWPGKENYYKGQHPHGSLLTTYVSAEAMQAMKNKNSDLPDGSMVVKENYTADSKLDSITVMYKRAGYNSEAGDWFWLKYSVDGTIAKEGKPRGCIACHAMVKGNDWLFTGALERGGL